MVNKFSLLLRGSFFRVVQSAISIIVGLVMMPFLLSTLGEELYGLWVVISSIVGTYYLLDMGFVHAVTRYVVKYIHQNKIEQANRVINSALLIYSILALVLLSVSVVASLFGVELLVENQEHIDIAKILIIIAGLSVALEFPAKAFPGIINAYLRFDTIAIVRLTKTIADALLIYFALSNGYGLIALSLITFSTGLVSTVIYISYSTRLFKDLKIKVLYIDLNTLRDIFNFSKWVFIADISSLLKDKVDIWFVTFFLGLGSLPVYYVSVRLVDYAVNFSMQATNMSTPIFTEFYAKNDSENLSKSFIMFTKANIAIGVLAVAVFFTTGEKFIGFWMNEKIDIQLAYFTLIVLSIGRFTKYFSLPINSILLTKNKHKLIALVGLFELILSLVLCILLIPAYGVKGAGFAISIPFIIGNTIILPLISKRYLNFKLGSLLKRLLLYLFCSVLLSYVMVSFDPYNTQESIISICFSGVITVIGVFIVSLLLWEKEDWNFIFRIISDKRRKVLYK